LNSKQGQQKHQALIAFGGNLGREEGNVQATFDSACLALHQHCTLLQQSKLYQTPALLAPNASPQPDYLNAVVKVKTHLPAADLLLFLHQIEHEHGRKRDVHWGSRTLDLDLLTYDTMICHDAQLTLPHPRLHQRLFVLQPLADVCPQWIHPSRLQDIPMMMQLIKKNNDLCEGRLWTA